MILLNKPSLVFVGSAIWPLREWKQSVCCDMNEFVNVEEVENENGHGRVKVVKIRIDSGNNKQN